MWSAFCKAVFLCVFNKQEEKDGETIIYIRISN